MSNDDGMPDLSDLYGEFVSENKEILEKFSRDLVALENSPHDHSVINGLFRSAHTLKGNSGFIGLTDLGNLAHKMENVLDSLREGKIAFFPEINDVFFAAVDMASQLLEDFIGGGGQERDIPGIVGRLEGLLSGPTVHEDILESPLVPVEIHERDDREPEGKDGKEASFMRVSTVRLDRMVNLVGELATGRSRLMQISNELKGEELKEIAAYINNISSQLQSEVLGIRMVPVKDLFNRFFRLVRDTSRMLDKDVKLVIKGEETELDKSVIEFLYDPVVHLVRNCIGHGIEKEEERAKAGKSRSGTITLNAYHEHNSIFIQVEDDGRGLDIDAIKKRALERGIVSADDVRTISDEDAARFIFSSGFSTASKVDSISGRGVGMDVVKANIEKIGGDVRLDWEAGKSTTITVRVPLTLAIVQLFLVREGRHIFGIPMPYVDETIMINEENVEYMKGEMIYMIRHKAVPVKKLAQLFDLEKRESEDGGKGRLNTVILNQMGMKLGIVIDSFMGKVETVIKPLGTFIDNLSTPLEGISGASILGTGEVVLVLDVPALWKTL